MESEKNRKVIVVIIAVVIYSVMLIGNVVQAHSISNLRHRVEALETTSPPLKPKGEK